MKTLLLVMGASVLIAAPATANEYAVVNAYSDSVNYLDPATIRSNGNTKTFWAYTVYAHTNGLGIDWTSQHVSLDCMNERSVTTSVIGYRINGTVVANTDAYPSIQHPWINIPPETGAAAEEDAVCRGNVLVTESGASFSEIVPIARRRLIQIANRSAQPTSPVSAPSMSHKPVWRSVLRQVGRAMQENSSTVGIQPEFDSATEQQVYSASECIGPIVVGVCHGTILSSQATHPVCHGEMLNGACTGPMF